MLKRGNYFPEQYRDEKVERFTHRHYMSFILPWGVITLMLFIVIPILVRIYAWDLLINLLSVYGAITASGLYLLTILAVFMYAWFNYYLNITIVTTSRLIDIRQDGWFNRRVAEQNLLRVQDVSSRMKGILQTFFLYGMVVVETAGDTPNFEIPNIPKPYKIANTIMELHQKGVEKGSFYEGEGEAEGVLINRNIHKIKEKNPATLSPKSTSEFDQTSELPLETIDEEIITRNNSTSQNSTEKNHIESDKFEGSLEEGKIIKF